MSRVSIDANWYDSWGCKINNDAALLWVVAVSTAKQIGSVDRLFISELQETVKRTISRERFNYLIHELNINSKIPFTIIDDEIILKTARSLTIAQHKASIPKGGTTQVPNVFVVTDSLREWAKKNNFDSLDLESETQNFLDYHAAKGTQWKDWTRAWQLWIRRSYGYKQIGKSTIRKNESIAKGASPLLTDSDDIKRFYSGTVVELPRDAAK